MDDDLATIRSQMNQTRTDLSEKLETLESRVSDGMQSTGAVVTDTMTSVRDAVQSVSQTLDVRRQVQRHPWIAVGASFALGCLAARLSSRPARLTVIQSDRSAAPPPDDRRQSGAGILSLLGVAIRDAAALALPLAMKSYLTQHADVTTSASMAATSAGTVDKPPMTLHSPGPGRPLNRQFGTARSL